MVFYLVQDKERHKDILGLLGNMPDERYALLVNLGKKITDYYVDHDKMDEGNALLLKVVCYIYCV
jgi:pre-mRNA-splicing helicase BRR2